MAADKDVVEGPERIVLGAMMLDASVITGVTELVTEDSFVRPAHAVIYRHVVAARDAGEPTDPTALMVRLSAAGELNKVGGGAYLHTLIAAVPTTANALHYAGIIADHAQQRRIRDQSARLAQVAEIGDAGRRAELLAGILEDLSSVGGAATDLEAKSARRAHITWASEIEPKPVVWAWEDSGQGRIPAGSLSAAAGREGTGKSSFGIWLAARITTGTLPGAFYGRPRRVLYVAVEDSWEHTLAPRLIAAGAELSMVGRFEVVTDEGDDVTLSLPVDNNVLEGALKDHDVALVVVDPLMSVISERVDTHRERDVRTALDPLAKIANRTGSVILGIAHFSKGSSTDAASLITGSGAFKNVPRSIFGFAKDEASEDGTRVMTQVKNSLGLCDELPSLGYVIESAKVETPTGIAVTGRFAFTGESDRSVHDVLRDSRGDKDPEERQDRTAAEEFLRRVLATGPRLSSEIDDEARQLGISESTLKRARKRVNVQAEQIRNETKKRNEWWISLPFQGSQGVRGSEDQGQDPDPLPDRLGSGGQAEGQGVSHKLWPSDPLPECLCGRPSHSRGDFAPCPNCGQIYHRYGQGRLDTCPSNVCTKES